MIANKEIVEYKFFQTVVEENPGNIIMSPLSAAVVLGMVAYGARGETENQFRKVLHLPSLGTSGYQALIDTTNVSMSSSSFRFNIYLN